MNLVQLTSSGLVLALVLIATFPKVSRAASQDDLLNRIQLLEIQIQQLKELKNQQKMAEDKEKQCLKAVGLAKFCQCIAESLPGDIGFEQYIHTIVSTPDERQDGTLTPEEQKRIDAAKASREKCVAKGFFR